MKREPESLGLPPFFTGRRGKNPGPGVFGIDSIGGVH